MNNKTGISEKSIGLFALNLIVFAAPLLGIDLTMEQMQAASVLSGIIGMFILNARKKQKAAE